MSKMGSLKKRLKEGETIFGTFNTLPSASVVDVMGCSGLDFIVVDCEHGPISLETAQMIVQAAEAREISPIIRVPVNESHFILRSLDIGAHGVQVPHISTQQDAHKVVQFSKYGPEGDRGYSPFTKVGNYGLDPANHASRMNENSLIVLNVEGIEGIKNLDEIINVSGIDVVFIGPYDLSQSLGYPGKVDSKEVIDAIKKSTALVRKKGLACGSFARDLAYLDILIDCGVQYITYGVDANLVLNAYENIVNLFHKKIRK